MTHIDYSVNEWPRASDESVANYKIRSKPADFFVEETLGFELSGEGEHVYLMLEKIGQNTTAIADRLAKFAGVRSGSIGYAGLKDRDAVTRQWFSVQLPQVGEADWQGLDALDLHVLKVSQHAKKLRKGAIAFNRFELLLREVEGDRLKIDSRLEWIRDNGVPNYFGPQRFGRSGDNVNNAIAWLQSNRKLPSRQLKGIYLSSIRSYLFNQLLACRVRKKIWNKAVKGDVFLLNGTNSCFYDADLSISLQQRIQKKDIHPGLMLFGEDGLNCSGEAWEFEQQILNQYQPLTKGLQTMNMKKAWRSSRLLVTDLQWEWSNDNLLLLTFKLPPGTYATSVLAEL